MIDRNTPWTKLKEYERQWFNDGTYPSCLTCKSGQWMVGIGQGFRCTNDNQIALPTNGCKDMSLNWWPIPHRTFVCRQYNSKRKSNE